MMRILTLAADEWRYWLRSNLAMSGMALVSALLVATAVLTFLRMDAERHARIELQAAAEETFLAQPDRHPHRMVHYGHYVFRTPAPLAVFDPGLDPVTGQSVFLEGHRQNAAMFADAAASANLGGLGSLTPALIYQVFAPLLLILLGHAAFVRERESSTLAPLLAQGVRGGELLAGKALAQALLIGLLLLPMGVACAYSLAAGESWLAAGALVGIHAAYLLVWSGLVLLASAMFRQRSVVLASLTALWVTVALIVPGLAVNLAAKAVPAPGKVETDLMMLTATRELGDGHNAGDPAFASLRAQLLAQYGVQNVEDLPVNFRGIVAEQAEDKLTAVLNDFAERRMANESAQAAFVRRLGWVSPAIALGSGSRAIAGTDLETYHRFLREAETVRFDFVQSLNRVHAEQLAYADDVRRSSDVNAEQRTRVSAQNWALLGDYRFEPASPASRIGNSTESVAMLLAWLLLVAFACGLAGRTLQP
jgi:ABC-2 type transport system permease protein